MDPQFRIGYWNNCSVISAYLYNGLELGAYNKILLFFYYYLEKCKLNINIKLWIMRNQAYTLVT